MGQRLNVLISAYACEPNKGSEPEVGWQWALQMARFHDVTVLTRANNRSAIEQELERRKGRQPLPKFVYHDCGPLALKLKKHLGALQLYYLLWQRSARARVARLHQAHRYDLLHHVTFAAFRYPTALWGHGVPCLWGPVGGAESIPLSLLPWSHPVSLGRELFRNVNNGLQTSQFSLLRARARASALTLVTTLGMQQVFARLGLESTLMPTIGLNAAELPYRAHRPSDGKLKLLFVGNIIALKGIELALEALNSAQTAATLTLIGCGNYLGRIKRQAAVLGFSEQVKFLGRLPRAEVLKVYADYDLFIFPSLHDTGGYAVIEAMANELPVICLDCGGPAVAVCGDCGIKVPVGSRSDIVAALAEAIRWYDGNRAALASHGQAARKVVLHRYDWDRKGEEMNQRYHEALGMRV